MQRLTAALLCGAALAVCAQSAAAHEIKSPQNPATPPAFDITQASATTDGPSEYVRNRGARTT